MRLLRPLLRSRWLLLSLLFCLIPGTPAARAENRCDAADRELFSKVPSWSELREWHAKYPDCDDGALSEGVSDDVVISLAKKWQDLPKLESQIKRHPDFKDFVLGHIDATTDWDDLQAVLDNATQRCPKRSSALCASIAEAARKARDEAKQNAGTPG